MKNTGKLLLVSTIVMAGCNFLAAMFAHGETASDCDSDAAHVGSSAFVKQARKELGLEQVEISFQGCPDVSYSTTWMHGTYLISYPLLTDRGKYKAPVVHELSHVFQFERVGSPATLLGQLGASKTRVELGADFIAGVLYGRLWRSEADSFEYQTDISVLGSFHKEDRDFHGTTVDRTNAFRLGFFIKDKAVGGDIWQDHLYFQKTLFSQFEERP